MRIVVDLQACQSESVDVTERRALLQLAGALADAGARHEVRVLISDRAPHRIPRLRRELAAFDEAGRIDVWRRAAGALSATPVLAGEVDAIVHAAVLRDREPDRVVTADALLAARERSLDARAAASHVIAKLEACEPATPVAAPAGTPAQRPRLAFVSPMPPERTGVAAYNARLLPELARFYDIDVVANQSRVDLPPGCEAVEVVDPASFGARYDDYARVLYHVGNSHYHAWMLELLQDCPGTVALHDVFLGDLANWLDAQPGGAGTFQRALLDGHGYGAALALARGAARIDLVRRCECNSGVLDAANGVIVHSAFAARIAARRYARFAKPPVAQAALCRAVEAGVDRAAARARLRIDASAFVVASFGFVNHVKLHDRIVAAWLASGLARDAGCRLVFVGESGSDAYHAALAQRIARAGLAAPIVITGFADDATFADYLAAADVAIQLRSETRGESSGAVLDCLAHGLPLITNGRGALAELPTGVALQVPEEFSDDDLVGALEALWRNRELRAGMSRAGLDHLARHHDPAGVAHCYAEAIERFANDGPRARQARDVAALATVACEAGAGDAELAAIAEAVADNRPRTGDTQWLVDVTPLVDVDLRTGIERVVRAILLRLVEAPPPGVRVEAVRFDGRRFVYARRFMARWLELAHPLQDAEVEARAGDRFVGLAWSPHAIPVAHDELQRYANLGVDIAFVVYDILPLRHPEWFPAGLAEQFRGWLCAVALHAHRIVAISRQVADDVHAWLDAAPPPRALPIRIAHFPLGGDIASSVATTGLPADANTVLSALAARPALLMVGTVEPRKGHAEALAAFDELWRRGVDATLAIVGKPGWMTAELESRIRAHAEFGRRLLRIDVASDEYVERLYGAASALLVASHGEGFGLPIVEAARHGKPVIARDLAVFREVAGDGAWYFRGDGATDLADSIAAWLELARAGRAPRPDAIRRSDWAESAALFVEALDGRRDDGAWQPVADVDVFARESVECAIDFAAMRWPAELASASGLSSAEPWGRWSDATTTRSVVLRFARPLPRVARVALTARAFGENCQADTRVIIGGTTSAVRFAATDSTVEIVVATDGEQYAIEVLPPAPLSPASLGVAPDRRAIGIGFVRLEVTALPEPQRADVSAAAPPGSATNPH
jgi:glycosyltransferase involved in cell wall biosynthesis